MTMTRSLLIRRTLVYAVMICTALLTISPFLLVISTSLKTMNEININGPLALPDVFHWENFTRIWEVGNFVTYYKNSLIVTVVVVAFVVMLSLLGAYPFAFMKFKGKGIFFLIVLWGLTIPLDLIIIPLFNNLKSMGLLNTIWSLILPQIALNIPFSIFLLRGFMKDIPYALLESARIDGSTEAKNLYYIIMPMLYAPMVSLIVFTAIGTWNNFMLPTILIQNDQLRTLPVGLNYFQTKFTMDFPMIATAAVVSALPVALVYIAFQRNILSGVMVGALKE
ncbi:carbohydrate ABC transporter permease [Cohnella cholangitidis]|uniref:Carbohydrate ABC transporter permease n=1 Tax=Cohnella cholangitidis TaxID=2598458 RepID=A0A7G5C498_9BACL|nr:carbohydrate ABC transporter permease [Cohnella cholangitidis]QMV44032.1 carbohydrate ABC transporter permease [Cohnella cholangitidis]